MRLNHHISFISFSFRTLLGDCLNRNTCLSKKSGIFCTWLIDHTVTHHNIVRRLLFSVAQPDNRSLLQLKSSYHFDWTSCFSQILVARIGVIRLRTNINASLIPQFSVHLCESVRSREGTYFIFRVMLVNCFIPVLVSLYY